ncbi:hypothetical protein UFOVP931_13 [uncultured Caudovirales phage]|uniref:Pectate lyase superfamily protein n=1 Tax=uncultured Caudovirales phage TaxID=2100421 RepID=A0A6J5PKR0_9CAUD|nr:hypothetical protein UFOVP931_13 [uncultured Caudovirales phage]CAB4199878.1 hypothetical protein UFOVP1358_19 [uncultured Caudovirales phage]
MSVLSINPPYPVFTDVDGDPLNNGYIYLGVANQNPEVSPIAVYWDKALTIPAAQPIRTSGGYPVRNGTPSRLYANGNYSITVRNKVGTFIYSSPNVNDFTISYGLSTEDSSAVGDGITDDTAALNGIDVTAPYGSTLFFEPGKTYRTTAGLVFKNITSLKFQGSSVKPDASFISAGGVAVSMGSTIATYSAFAPFVVSANSKNVTLPTGVSAAVGDVLLFKSTSVRVADGIANYLHGMWTIVESASGQDIVITTPFYDAFSVTGIERRKGAAKMAVDGLVLDLTNSANTTPYFVGLFMAGSNMVVESSKFTGNKYAMVGAQFAGENVSFRGNVVNNFLNIQGLPLPGRVGYGVLLEANNGVISGNIFADNKHAVSGGGRSWVNINPIVENNLITENIANGVADGYAGSVDMHCNVAGRFIVKNNHITGYGQLINVRNKSALITGNTLVQLGTPASAIAGNELPFDDVVISENKVSLFALNSMLFGSYSGAAGMTSFKNISIRDNTVVSGRIFAGSTVGVVYEKIAITGNRLENGDFLLNLGGNAVAVDGLTISGNQTINSKGLIVIASDSAASVSNVRVTDNTHVSSAIADYVIPVWFAGAALTKTAQFKNIEVCCNVIDHTLNTSTSWCMSFINGTFTRPKIGSNTLTRGASQPTKGATFAKADFVELQLTGNVLDSDIYYSTDATVSLAFTKLNFSGNSLATWSTDEASTDITYTDSIVSANNFHSVVLNSRVGSGGWAGSNELQFFGNRTRKSTGGSVTIGSQAVGNKFRSYGNTLGDYLVDNSLTYYAVPVGNMLLGPNPQYWKGSTLVSLAGEVMRNSNAPTTGTWAVRDRVINMTPTVGQAKAWVCTVAGTPGTWVSEGNL